MYRMRWDSGTPIIPPILHNHTMVAIGQKTHGPLQHGSREDRFVDLATVICPSPGQCSICIRSVDHKMSNHSQQENAATPRRNRRGYDSNVYLQTRGNWHCLSSD